MTPTDDPTDDLATIEALLASAKALDTAISDAVRDCQSDTLAELLAGDSGARGYSTDLISDLVHARQVITRELDAADPERQASARYDRLHATAMRAAS